MVDLVMGLPGLEGLLPETQVGQLGQTDLDQVQQLEILGVQDLLEHHPRTLGLFDSDHLVQTERAALLSQHQSLLVLRPGQVLDDLLDGLYVLFLVTRPRVLAASQLVDQLFHHVVLLARFLPPLLLVIYHSPVLFGLVDVAQVDPVVDHLLLLHHLFGWQVVLLGHLCLHLFVDVLFPGHLPSALDRTWLSEHSRQLVHRYVRTLALVPVRYLELLRVEVDIVDQSILGRVQPETHIFHLVSHRRRHFVFRQIRLRLLDYHFRRRTPELVPTLHLGLVLVHFRRGEEFVIDEVHVDDGGGALETGRGYALVLLGGAAVELFLEVFC